MLKIEYNTYDTFSIHITGLTRSHTMPSKRSLEDNGSLVVT